MPAGVAGGFPLTNPERTSLVSNQQINQLLVYGLVALIACIILYLLRWYLFGGLVCFGLYHLYRQLNRPRS